MKRLLVVSCVLLSAALLTIPDAHAQGCVAIRHFSTGDPTGLSASGMNTGDLLIGTSYRYFESFRHFRGREEEPDRIANNTEVVNYSHAVDLNATYALSRRAYATFTLPLVMNARSSLYEHGRSERNNSFSRGLADARIGVGYWLLDAARSHHLNAAVGVGLKLPTGSYNASDIFYNVGPEGRPEVRPVDQSIQPGDGGVGVTLDLQLYYHVASNLSLYGAGFYLLNPRETNGVRTFREALSPLLANESVASVPDQYSLRTGVSYVLPAYRLSGTLGVRYEGVPVEDVVGGNAGFRRPGSVFSIEPGIGYTVNGVSVFASVPVALIRNRPQSITDRETEMLTGTPRNGDAAFADYLVNVGFVYRLRGGSRRAQPVPDFTGGERSIDTERH